MRGAGATGRGFFFQAEDGIRDSSVTGVQTCALPISQGGRNRICRKAAESSVDVLARAVGRALIESDYGKCGTCNRGAASEAATRALFSCHLLPAEQSERSCNRALRADRWDSAAVGTLVNVPGVGRIRKIVSLSCSTHHTHLSAA